MARQIVKVLGAVVLYLNFYAICSSFRTFFCGEYRSLACWPRNQGDNQLHLILVFNASTSPIAIFNINSYQHCVSHVEGPQLMLRNVTTRSTPFARTATSRSLRSYASSVTQDADEEDIAAARSWLSRLNADTIRQNTTCDISFSRSSGPGGQNVNKCVSYPSIK